MPQPKAVEYIYVCSNIAESEDNRRINAILEVIPEAETFFAPQGRISVRFQEKLHDDESNPAEAV